MLALILSGLACQSPGDRATEGSLTPDEQGVLHDLTEAEATELLGFQPLRPVDLPPGMAIQELRGQATPIEQSAPGQPSTWGEPYVAIYEIQPKDEAAMDGPIRGVQLHQATVDPIPSSPGGIAEWESLTLGTQQVQKSVNQIGTTGNANVIYRWAVPSMNLHLLAIASLHDMRGVDAIEAMIAAMVQ